MINNKKCNMVIQKAQHIKIIEKQGKFTLEYMYKITKKSVKRKNSETPNTFYQGFMPPELVDYLDVKDNTIFFYEYENELRITSRVPKVEHQKIKIQKSNQFSLPKSYLKPEDFEFVKLSLDLSRVDTYKNGYGVLTIELV